MIDNEYFIICQPREDHKRSDLLPILGPDEDTVDIPYQSEPLPLGHKPLVFTNAAKPMRDRRGSTTTRKLPEILFDGFNPIVRGDVREKLLNLNIPNLALQPSIYIDDWGQWHEDLWYLAFLEDFDHWDRKKSDVGGKVWVADEYLYDVYRVSFDDNVMQQIPLQDRLLFQINAVSSFVIAHRSIASIFQKHGSLVVSLADYPKRP